MQFTQSSSILGKEAFSLFGRPKPRLNFDGLTANQFLNMSTESESESAC